ncbi:IclR family transcriptional regulator [Amycolatopsis sp. K13G38]|uniref:IclR family transcriptional regulator n=1 Tax=Amycolatopsis acididurans TaxID=2724524 RepID=A0ABX1IYE0_9PSEU|nr:IclR family transcriptional regulator [Amycolatopsis acididurans]NKQ52517.1 IclR family transcriptional regulator [Amycolatopsis acididurans]
MPRTSQPGRTVSARLLDVLFAFEPGRSALSLADLVRRTGLPHATVRRLAGELTAAGALERRPDGRFTVGLRLWQLGTLAPLTEPLRNLAQPFLEDLYTALHQHVQLAVLEGHEAVIIERLSAPDAPELVSRVGGRLPLHCSGVGKVLLSHAGPRLIETVLSGELRRYTPNSVVSPAALREQIAGCRRTGAATVRGELTADAESVATRIVNGEGRVVAALSVVVRAKSVKPQAVLPSVIASGLGISRLLGWRPGVKIRGTDPDHH